jgi:general secretion pathway protein C
MNVQMSKTRYINLLLFFLSIAVVAKVASDFISYRLSHTFPASEKKTNPAPSASSVEDLGFFSPILEKGLFGKATQGKLTSIAVNAGSTKTAASPGDLILLGTAVGSSRETFALMQKSSTHEEQAFRLGEKVFDLGTLEAVKKDSVEIMSGGRRIKIVVPTASLGEAANNPSQAPQTSAGLAPQITSPGNYVIDQRALNAALDNIGKAMTDARLLPSVKDGKVEGFRVSEVKPAGIFGMVGIKNGDVLLSINDFKIDSPEKAIQSLASLKGQTSIKLDMLRDGQPTTMNYDIR